MERNPDKGNDYSEFSVPLVWPYDGCAMHPAPRVNILPILIVKQTLVDRYSARDPYNIELTTLLPPLVGAALEKVPMIILSPGKFVIGYCNRNTLSVKLRHVSRRKKTRQLFLTPRIFL